MPEQTALHRQIDELVLEHRDLDDVIARLSEQLHVDQLQIRRLKARKLRLKDTISRLQSMLIPDLGA